MSDEIIAGLIGLAGGLVGSLIGYIATTRSTKHQLAAMEWQAERDRIERNEEKQQREREKQEEKKERIRDKVIELMADILTEHTAERAKADSEFLNTLEYKMERLLKTLHLQGDYHLADQLSREGHGYLRSVRRYANDGMSRVELDHYRMRVREEIRTLMSNTSLWQALFP